MTRAEPTLPAAPVPTGNPAPVPPGRPAPLPIGRLAPSPTGRLHLGHARSFLLAWWHARARGGRCVLRLDDLDAPRVRPDYTDGVLRDLEWLGLDWDGPPLLQSTRRDAHTAAALELAARGLAYPCTCTRREIELAISAPHEPDATDDAGAAGDEPAAGDGTRRYPGTCRGRYASAAAARAATDRPPVWRFLVPSGPITVHDALLGPFTEDLSRTTGDFPLTTRDGSAAYQLACILDDAHQSVTEVLRGADLLPSTVRQASLQHALDLASPIWLHVPLVVDATGSRLAKRTDALSLAELRDARVDPRALVAWAARTSGQPAPERLTPLELLPEFDLARLPAAPPVADERLLRSLRRARP